MLRQRQPREHDPAHLAFVRAAGCVVCRKPTDRPIEAAHIRYACIAIGKPPTGMQEKPSDKWTCGLCDYHHRTGILAQHKMAEADFWAMHGLNPFEIAVRLWIESGGAARAEGQKNNPRPVKLRKVKARKPVGQRAKIPGRALQSRSTFPQGRKLQSRNSFERRT